MNKTVTANIGGFVFNIDEQAYESLQKYLRAIRNQMPQDCIEEVMQDIELRIAEIFREKLNELKREVINVSDVDTVISIMGEPEAYGDGESSSNEKSSSSSEEDYDSNRQIFRDPDDGILGGVCSGLAAYMNWDPLVVRLIFVLLFFGFGTGFLIYILLWIIVPEAKTASERLRMRGQKVNVENIKEKFNDIKNDFKGSGKNTGNKIKKGIHQLVDNFSDTFGSLARVFATILAILMMIGAVAIIFILIKMILQSEIIYLFTFDHTYSITYSEMETLFFNSPTVANLGYTGFVLMLTTISISLILTSIRLIFKIKTPNVAKIVISVVFSVSIFLMIACAAKVGHDFSDYADYSEQYKITDSTDTLYVNTYDDIYFSENLAYNEDILFETIKIDKDNIIFGYPEFKIKRSNSDQFEMIIQRESRGSHKREALSRAEALHYKFYQKDSLLTLSPYFSTPKSNKLRMQKVTITLLVPEGKVVHLSKKTNRIYNEHADENEHDDETLPMNTYLTMTENGLKLK